MNAAHAIPPKHPASSSQWVEIVAPCAMVEGFTFMANYNDESVPVTVPPGGVKEGQIFSIPYPINTPVATEMTPFLMHHQGHWKDKWWQCFRFGLWHPTVWNACCCPQILAAQVLTRLQLDWLGNHEHEKGTFSMVCALVVIYWCVTLVLTTHDDPFARFLSNVLSWGFGFYTWFILTKLRTIVRTRYKIPSQWWGEDCCMALWCSCCSVAQMARQTADYEQHAAVCCSATGVPFVVTV